MRRKLADRYTARVMEAWRAGPQGPGLTVRAATEADPCAEVMLYDEIGPWGVTASDFVAALAACSGPVRVRVNSPGGDVFDGLAMANAAANHKPGCTVCVDGLAASAATLLCAVATTEMATGAMMMIHRSWTVAAGNCTDMRQVADVLDKVDGTMAGMYAAKCGKPAPDCLAAMQAETWMSADEAKAFGLADTVLPPAKRTAADPETAADPITEEPAGAAAGAVRAGASVVDRARRRLAARESC